MSRAFYYPCHPIYDSLTTTPRALRTDNADARVFRFDVGELRAPVRRDDGSLLAEGFVARPGVYVYQGANGEKRRELVPKSTLESPAALASLRRVGVTLNHPPDRRVTKDNSAAVLVGDVGTDVGVADDGRLKADFAIRRADAVSAIDSGTRYLSPGYYATLDETPGVDAEYGAYDAIQTAREYNHVAIVPNPRGGVGCELRADDAGHVDLTFTRARTRADGASMSPIVLAILASLGLKAPEGATDDSALHMILGAIGAKDTKIAEVEGAMDAATAEAAKQTAAVGEMATKMDAATNLLAYDGTTPATTPETKARLDAMDAYADERAKLLGLAAKNGIAPADLKGKALGEVRRAIVTKLDATVKTDASDAYLTAYLDFAAKSAPAPHPYDAVNPAANPARNDAADRTTPPPEDRAFASRSTTSATV